MEGPVQLPLLLLQKMKVTGGVAGVQDVLQGTFDAHKTCGNGACAIHSVFGVPDQSGEYFCEQARQLFCDSLGVTYSDPQSEVKAALMDRWERNVWLDMVRLCIDVDFNVSHLDIGVDDKVKIFCATLARDRVACQQIMRRHRQSEELRSVLNSS